MKNLSFLIAVPLLIFFNEAAAQTRADTAKAGSYNTAARSKSKAAQSTGTVSTPHKIVKGSGGSGKSSNGYRKTAGSTGSSSTSDKGTTAKKSRGSDIMKVKGDSIQGNRRITGYRKNWPGKGKETSTHRDSTKQTDRAPASSTHNGPPHQ